MSRQTLIHPKSKKLIIPKLPEHAHHYAQAQEEEEEQEVEKKYSSSSKKKYYDKDKTQSVIVPPLRITDEMMLKLNVIDDEPIIRKPKQKSSSNEGTPWIEKYRPTNIKDVVGNPDLLKQFQRLIDNQRFTNLIFAGNPGVGKTTIMRCLLKAIIPEEFFSDLVMEINASDIRGAELKEVIDNFVANTHCMQEMKTKYPDLEPIKVLLLDEADNLTEQAQLNVEHAIESYKQMGFRFGFTCNNPSKIKETIHAHCRLVVFDDITSDQIQKRLVDIINIENMAINDCDKAIEAISYCSGGDMRIAINILQTVKGRYCFVADDNTTDETKTKNITEEDIYKITDVPSRIVMIDLFRLILTDKMKDGVILLVNLFKSGYSELDLVKSMLQTWKMNLDEKQETRKLIVTEEIFLFIAKQLILQQTIIFKFQNDTRATSIQLACLVARLCNIASERN